MTHLIRDAVPDDAAALIQMGAAFFAEAGLPERFNAIGLPEITFCPESFIRSCEYMADPSRGVLLVAEEDGEVVGMLGAAFAPAPWNLRIKLSQEQWWYCRKGKRRGAGHALLREYEARATAQGVVISGMVAENGLRGDAVGQLYKAKGYAPAESVYWKRLNSVVH